MHTTLKKTLVFKSKTQMDSTRCRNTASQTKPHNHVHWTASPCWDQRQTRRKCEIWQAESVWARPHCHHAWYWPIAPLMRRPQAFCTFVYLSLYGCISSWKTLRYFICVFLYVCLDFLLFVHVQIHVLEMPEALRISWITQLAMNIFKCVNMGPNVFPFCAYIHTYTLTHCHLWSVGWVYQTVPRG